MADVHSAGKKPQMYKDPETGKMKVRMVPSKQDVKSEKILTPAEKSGRERIAKKLPMKDFKKRYGDDAMQVKMATATKIAKNKYEGDNEASGMDETKGAPKGYHFTRSGKLRKGDAGVDGPGGPKLRSDPLDKQRSKIPPLPEKFANAAQQAAVMAKLKKDGKYKESVEENFNWKVSHAGRDVHVKAPHAGAAVKKAQKGFGNMDLTKAKITNLGKVGTPAKEVFAGDYKMPGKIKKEAVDATDTGGAEETKMAMNQVKQIRHYVDGIEKMVAKDGDMEEWVQNKLTKATDYLKSVYGYKTGKSDTNESVEEMRKYTPPTQAEIDADRKKDQRGKSRPSMSARSMNKKLYGKAMGSSKIPEATDKPPFDPDPKMSGPRKDEYGNVVKKKNVASFLAKKAMKKAMGEEQVDEISTDLKKRYVDKAKSDYKHQQFSRDIGKEMGVDKDTLKHYTRKMQKRTGGIGRATATMDESVEEAKSFDQKFKDHLKFTTSKSKSVQDYMKKKVADRDAMNKKNDPNAARKGYALSAVPPERAYHKARKKGMDPYNAKRAATAANRSLGGTKYRGRKLPEETQLDEMKANAAYTKAAKDIKAYAAKNGGIDKKDMMNFAADLELMGRAPNILQAGRILDRINTRFKGYDTDVRDRLSMYLKKHGLME